MRHRLPQGSLLLVVAHHILSNLVCLSCIGDGVQGPPGAVGSKDANGEIDPHHPDMHTLEGRARSVFVNAQ